MENVNIFSIFNFKNKTKNWNSIWIILSILSKFQQICRENGRGSLWILKMLKREKQTDQRSREREVEDMK
jgi:hypothetical protein